MESSFFEFKPVGFREEVAIVAPSSPFDRLHFNAGITELKLNKIRPVIDKAIFSHDNFLAGSDSVRSDIIIKSFANSSIGAIWTARGGYGSIRLLESFEKNIGVIRKNPKLFIGFSDVTAIHSWLVEKCGFVTVHGPNITTLDMIDKYSKAQIFELVSGKDKAFSIFNKNIKSIVHGSAKGIVKGGNLTTLVSLIGTPFEPDFNGSILFLEDVGEVPYRIDRLITQMRLAGKFKGVKAVILGDFSYKEFRPPADKSVNPYDIAASMHLEKDVPVMSNFPSGHGSTNMAFLLGAVAEMNTDARTLRYNLS
ncbi:MAG TPA: LD-carboxypeptidase [bacterium]|nr:LD-carboxypeptidase [bacterium]HPS30738.1 LD-carboxypeptidase [bacterium]